MSMTAQQLTSSTASVKTPTRRGGARVDLDRRNPLDRINNNAYRGVANMAMQAGDLEDITDYNALEDISRAKLKGLMSNDNDTIARLGQCLGTANGHLQAGELAAARTVLATMELLLERLANDNERQQKALAAVDVLDALQGLADRDKPVQRAKHWNTDTADACREILQDSEQQAEPTAADRQLVA